MRVASRERKATKKLSNESSNDLKAMKK